MDFIEIEISCQEDFRDILMAEMSELNYETFMETDEGFIAYIAENAFSWADLEDLILKYEKPAQIRYEKRNVKEKNWNEEWEKNYEPVIVEDQCLIRASFHQVEKSYPYEVEINPRMSFGTGHHETTWLMASYQLEIDHTHKKVLDIGCGTGILAILASRRGASFVTGIDNNDWAYQNALDNVALNGTHNVELKAGSVYESGLSSTYDLILANINRNVLLAEMPEYVKFLNSQGSILISGFYEEDEQDMIRLMEPLGFSLQSRKRKNRWSAMYFVKNLQ